MGMVKFLSRIGGFPSSLWGGRVPVQGKMLGGNKYFGVCKRSFVYGFVSIGNLVVVTIAEVFDYDYICEHLIYISV